MHKSTKKYKYQKEQGLETDLANILSLSKAGPVNLKDIVTLLGGKGKPLVLIFLSLPFCQPIQIPGVSTPFGIAIAFIALRIGFGHQIWLPKSILKKKIPEASLNKVLKASIALTKKIKRFTHPRMLWLCTPHFLHILHGIVLALLGLFLALPLPIPLSNLIAAWAIFLISFGLLEDDGLFILIGYIIPIFTALLVFFLVRYA